MTNRRLAAMTAILHIACSSVPLTFGNSEDRTPMLTEEHSDNSLYDDRRQAGRHLARKLMEYKGAANLVVLGLPRGGIPVAYEVAHRLEVPLDVFVVRKIGYPGREELAIGAIARDGVIVFNGDIMTRVPPDLAAHAIEHERSVLLAREKLYRGGKPFPSLAGKTAILVDDGLATGATMKAAIKALRLFSPAAIVAAVPVAPPETCESIGEVADKVVCAITPRPFFGVGMWYRDFSQTTDDEVLALLRDLPALQGNVGVQ